MAGNTRGKLKEQFEGIHRNFDWSKKHCIEALMLIKQHNPKLTKAIQELDTMIDTMDELTQDIYSKL